MPEGVGRQPPGFLTGFQAPAIIMYPITGASPYRSGREVAMSAVLRLIRSRRRNIWNLLAVLVVVALVAAACGDDETSTPPSTTVAQGVTTTTGGTGTTTPPPTTLPPEPRVLRFAVPSVTASIDHGDYQGTPSGELEPMWGAPFFNYVDPPGGGLAGIEDVEPFLAQSFEINADGSVTITLPDTVSEFGNELTSEDVKWTFERHIEIDFVTKFLLGVGKIPAVDPITIIDDKTFTVNVTEPNPFILAVLTLWNLSPIDSTEAMAHATDDDPWAEQWLNTNDAQFGPYLVDAFTPGEELRLKANPNFFGDQPYYSDVVIRAVPEASNRLQLISTGEVDFAQQLLPDQFKTLVDRDDIGTDQRPLLTQVPLILNLGFEPFADVRVRRAIAYAINRDALIEGPLAGLASVLDTQLPTLMAQPPAPSRYTYDPDLARQLLADAGFGPGGNTLAFTLTSNPGRPGPFSEQLAILIKSQLADVGIDVTIEVVASTADFEAAKRQDDATGVSKYEAWIDTSTPILPDPWYTWTLVHHSERAFSNHHGYLNTTVDEMLNRAQVEPAGPTRDQLLTDIHTILMEEVPWVPLLSLDDLIPVTDAIDLATWRKYGPLAVFTWALRP
jgi:peptide/nickel transport system substrate-binding protein